METTPKKVILKIVFVVLSLGVVFGITYGSWKIFNKPETKQTAEHPQAELNSDIKPYQPLLVPTDDWQVYKNEKFGYVIKYPKAWSAKEIEKNEKYEMVDFTSQEREITLMTKTNPKKLKPRDFFITDNGEPDFFSQSKGYSYGKVSGKDYYVFTPFVVFVPITVGIIDGSDFFVEIMIEDDSRDKILDSMLMSFKSTN